VLVATLESRIEVMEATLRTTISAMEACTRVAEERALRARSLFMSLHRSYEALRLEFNRSSTIQVPPASPLPGTPEPQGANPFQRLRDQLDALEPGPSRLTTSHDQDTVMRDEGGHGKE
jgi:hypothetical protein